MQLGFADPWINLSQFRSHKFFKVLYYDNTKFGAKITICCLGDVRIQLEKIKEYRSSDKFHH